jgi:hypothetical protein
MGILDANPPKSNGTYPIPTVSAGCLRTGFWGSDYQAKPSGSALLGKNREIIGIGTVRDDRDTIPKTRDLPGLLMKQKHD